MRSGRYLPPAAGRPLEQLRLFQLGRYHYQVLVTNLPLEPLNLWPFYNDRATVELIIRQLKGDYALGHIPTPGIKLDELVRAALLATRVSIGDATNLRHKILLMPAQLRRTHNRPRLALPASVAGEFAWRFALNKINKLKP